jgi:hypothetical protein
LVNLTISKNKKIKIKLLSLEFSEAKNQREQKNVP